MRPRTPPETLKVRGTFREDRHGSRLGNDGEIPVCPRWLEKEARAEWKRMTQWLARKGLISQADRGALALYCEAWGEFVRLRGLVRAQGDTVHGSTGSVVLNPLVRLKEDAAQRFIRLASQFGCTPAARARLQTVEQPQENQKARFFNTVG